MNETRMKGNYTGGHLLYGYRKEGKKVVADEQQADVVRFIFEQYSVGVYVKDIIAELDRRGIRYHGKSFGKNIVYNILKNEKYAGVYRFQGEEYDIFPQIVPTDVLDHALKVRAVIVRTRHGAVYVCVQDKNIVRSCVLFADMQLTFDRLLRLVFGRVSCVDDGCFHRS